MQPNLTCFNTNETEYVIRGGRVVRDRMVIEMLYNQISEKVDKSLFQTDQILKIEKDSIVAVGIYKEYRIIDQRLTQYN